MSNFDDFLNNLNSENENNSSEEKKEDSNLFDLNFGGSVGPQNDVPAEESAFVPVEEEIVESAPVEAEAPANDFFNFAAPAEDPAPVEAAAAEEAPANDFFNFAAPAEDPVPAEAAAAEEAPANDFFNFAAPAEDPAPAEAPAAEEAPAEEEMEEITEDVVEEVEEGAVEEVAEEVAAATPAFDFGGFGEAPAEADSVAGTTEVPAMSFGEVPAEVAPMMEVAPAAESAAVETEAPKPVKRIIRRAKPKKKHTVVGELIKIVIGGLLAFPLAHYIVWGTYLTIGKPAPGGLYKFPTPFIQASYKYAKNFPGIPVEVWKYTMYGFDPARDLAPDEPEVIQVENPRQVAQVAQTDAGKPVDGGNLDANAEVDEGGFGFGMDESEVDSAAAAATKFDSAHLPQFDAASVVPEWDLANLDEFQDTMMKISFLKKDDEFTKKMEDLAKEKIAKFGAMKEAKVLNKAMSPLIKKENHGKGVLVVGKIVKTSKLSGKTVMTVKLKGLKKEVKIIGPAPKNGKGKEFIFTGVVFDPTQDEAINAKNVYIWRGIFKSVDGKKKAKEVKEEKPAPAAEAPKAEEPAAAPAAEAPKAEEPAAAPVAEAPKAEEPAAAPAAEAPKAEEPAAAPAAEAPKAEEPAAAPAAEAPKAEEPAAAPVVEAPKAEEPAAAPAAEAPKAEEPAAAPAAEEAVAPEAPKPAELAPLE